jgi:hypothetical protein
MRRMSEPLSPKPANDPDPPREAPARPRRFQFRLRTLLILMGLLGVLLATLRAYLVPYHEQRATMALVERLNGSCQTRGATTWASRFTLTPSYNVVLANLADCDQPAEYIDAIARLPSLETLVVGGAAFGDDQLAALRKLTTLRWLVLDSTRVTPAAVEALRESLPHLHIHESEHRIIAHFRSLGGQVFASPWDAPSELQQRVGRDLLGHLRGLNLSGTQVTDAELADLAELKELKFLWLSNTKVTDAGLAHLAGLTSLRWLGLSKTKITDAGLTHLRGLQNLQLLRLKHTKVTDAGLAHLAGLTELADVSLEGTEVTDAIRERLRGPIEDPLQFPRD